MKVRSGFVSNSSSSSFVAVGFEVPCDDLEWSDFLKRNFKIDLGSGQYDDYWEIDSEIHERTGLHYYPTDYGIGCRMVGYQLAYAIDEGDTGAVEIDEAIEKVRLVREEWNFDVPIKIFWGCKSS